MTSPLKQSLLHIYLNDHLAGATGGVELARRAAASNQGSSLGDFLDQLASDLEDDRDAVLELMRARGMRVNPVKVAGGWMIEKLGRLKLNGQLTGYSPLSRVVELEGLLAGTSARASLFELLAAFAGDAERGDYAKRAEKARVQLVKLRAHLQDAYLEAFVQDSRESAGATSS